MGGVLKIQLSRQRARSDTLGKVLVHEHQPGRARANSCARGLARGLEHQTLRARASPRARASARACAEKLTRSSISQCLSLGSVLRGLFSNQNSFTCVHRRYLSSSRFTFACLAFDKFYSLVNVTRGLATLPGAPILHTNITVIHVFGCYPWIRMSTSILFRVLGVFSLTAQL